MIDYDGMDDPERVPGPRAVDPSERAAGLWDFGAVHSVDYGVEIETAAGRYFTVTWDPTNGQQEGIGIREARSIGRVVRPDADIAVWDVSASSLWAPLVGHRVEAVVLDYLSWSDEGGWWCPVLTITSVGGGVVLGLGDAHPDGTPVPSADNVLVVAYPTNITFLVPNPSPGSGSLDA